jgi:hypothetical protein
MISKMSTTHNNMFIWRDNELRCGLRFLNLLGYAVQWREQGVGGNVAGQKNQLTSDTLLTKLFPLGQVNDSWTT